uniref:Uncharacterized protein n=1 Tax=Leersia perrieri TaxID=77586 RepID=A0A0D9X208_9ORYZ
MHTTGKAIPSLPPFAGVDQLKNIFATKGLDAIDVATLSGTHSVIIIAHTVPSSPTASPLTHLMT